MLQEMEQSLDMVWINLEIKILFLLQVKVQPISQHITDPDRGGQHKRRGCMVCWEADGIHLQGQGEKGWIPLSMHLGQGH